MNTDEGPVIVVKATGERIVCRPRRDASRPKIEITFEDVAPEPEPPLLTCAVCGEDLPQWQFGIGMHHDDQPLICWACSRGATPQWAWDLSFADQALLCDARAVLGHISRETRHG